MLGLDVPQWVCNLFSYYCVDGQGTDLFWVIFAAITVGIILFTIWTAAGEDFDDWFMTPIIAVIIYGVALFFWWAISYVVLWFKEYEAPKYIFAFTGIAVLATLLGRVINRWQNPKPKEEDDGYDNWFRGGEE